jgi:hypothetical protein
MSTALRTESNGLSGAISFNNIDNVKLTSSGPELLGVPLAPTAAANTNTTQVATTAFVGTAVGNALASGGAQPSNATPLMDAVGTPGNSVQYARGDHVHPQFTTPGNSIPASGTANGAAGTSTSFSRADHAHPTGPNSVSSSGYVTLPGGLMMQWGFGTFSPSGSAIIFPTSFPSACYSVMATPASTSGTETCAVSGQNQSGFTGRSTNGVGCFWMALGR